MESWVGQAAWNCYYSVFSGNATVIWEDPPLTNYGISQTVKAHNFWKHQIQAEKIQTPQSYYVSPLRRCLETADITFRGLQLSSGHPFVPTVKEWLREGISIHTCDHRSSRSWIAKNYPDFIIEPTFSEDDQQWNGITGETPSAQAYRTRLALSEIFEHDKASIISITAHSGEIRTILGVLEHTPFSLVTGAILPTLVKITKVNKPPTETTTQPWTTEAWCTNGPPVASVGGRCVCQDGVPPVATTPESSVLPPTLV